MVMKRLEVDGVLCKAGEAARVAGIARLFVCVYLSLILILDLTRKPRTGAGLYQRRPLPHLAMFICVYFDLIGLWQHERLGLDS